MHLIKQKNAAKKNWMMSRNYLMKITKSRRIIEKKSHWMFNQSFNAVIIIIKWPFLSLSLPFVGVWTNSNIYMFAKFGNNFHSLINCLHQISQNWLIYTDRLPRLQTFTFIRLFSSVFFFSQHYHNYSLLMRNYNVAWYCRMMLIRWVNAALVVVISLIVEKFVTAWDISPVFRLISTAMICAS